MSDPSEGSPTNHHVYSQKLDDFFQELDTNPEQGLSQQEAKQLLKEYGPNKLKEHETKSLLQILLDQIANPIVYLLTAAAVLAFVFGDIPEGIAIIIVLVLNTMIGFWMEYQARQSMSALQEMDKVMAKVIREGEVDEVEAETLVPGDLIQLEAGALVPADARMVEATELSIDEAALTGESVPVTKNTDPVAEDAPLGDRSNMVFKGTAVSNGKGRAVIVSTGMETEIGSISEMVGEAGEDEIPLNRKLEQLTKNLIWATLGLAAAFFCIGWLVGEDIYQLVQTSIAWTIAAIPEGLPIVASIALARGMLRLADHDVIVKRLAAVETLGETTVIFTDKTGTLTENKLSLEKVEFPEVKARIAWENNREKATIVAEDGDDTAQHDDRITKFFQIATLCNDAAIKEGEKDEQEKGSGDPLDLSLLQFGKAFDSERFQKLRDAQRLNQEPFDSDDMVMGTVYEIDGQPMLLCKGAPEAIFNRCSRSFTADGGKEFGDEDKKQWKQRNQELSSEGLRVIAFAFAEFDHLPDDDIDVEKDLMHGLTFLSLAGFIDPPSENVTEAVDTCRRAGITVEMVTGDHPGTARNIARQVNIVDQENDGALRGSDLREDVEEHDHQEVVNTRIFARVDPGQKLDLISYYRDNGDIVAMTGDGVNDAPALKKADIGIAMGEKGTQVAQEVADMVLKHDAFSSIVEAIREGRVIFGNIRKFIVYQLSYHLAEILVIAAISFSVFQLPLLPLQLLFLNLLSDVFPALALGIGKGSDNIMEQSPKDPEEPIISSKNWQMIGIYGVIMTIFIVGAYFFSSQYWGLSADISNNVAFFSLAFAQLWHVFNMREADEPIFDNQVTQNKYIWAALTFCGIVIIAAYLVPGISSILSFRDLQTKVWILIGTASLLPLITIQAIKELFSST